MFKVVIVEDEKNASDLLSLMLAEIAPDIKVMAFANNLQSAVMALSSQKPDLVFLDINLNNETGFDLLNHFPEPDFRVIITTGYDSYLLKAIKYSCLDYLLKPINPEELALALLKFRSEQRKLSFLKLQFQVLNENIISNIKNTRIGIPSSDGYEFIKKTDIIMCVANSNYTLIHSLNSEPVICSRNLGTVEQMIDDNSFFRTHKSFLVNLERVKKYLKNERYSLILENELMAEVSVRKREQLMEVLKVF